MEERTQSLRMTQEQLVRHERLAAIGEFSASIVHELRNPLSSVMGAAALHLGSVSIVQALQVTTLVFSLPLSTVGGRERPSRRDLAAASGVIRQQAERWQSARLDFQGDLNIISKELRDEIRKNKPLPVDCRPDADRVRSLGNAIDSADKAIAR